MKLKIFLFAIALILLCFYLFTKFVIQSPEDHVVKTLKELETSELTAEQKEKMVKLLEGPTEYGLPAIEVNFELNYDLAIHLRQHTQVRTNELDDSRYQIIVSFRIEEYEKSAVIQDNNFIFKESYQGMASFDVQKTGWNSWQVIGVRTTEFSPAEDGVWSGSFN